jgi:hypothetical protein
MSTLDQTTGQEPSPERRFLTSHGRVLVAALGHYAQAMTETAEVTQAVRDQRAADQRHQDPSFTPLLTAEELARAATWYRDAATAARAALAAPLHLREQL